MEKKLQVLIVLLLMLTHAATFADVLIDFDFRTTALPEQITTDGEVSTSGAVGSCTDCSLGRINIALSGYFQVDVPSCSVFNLTMKSAGSSARNVTLKYKLDGESEYTTLGVISVPQVGGLFALASTYPQLVSNTPISIRLENAPSGGQFHIHDLYVESSGLPSSAAEITAFILPNQLGDETINSVDGTISLNVAMGLDLTSVVPSLITLSANATVNPLPTDAVDFTDDVTYTVTAQDGTVKNWTVTVTAVASTGKDITSFKLDEAQIGDAAIDATNGEITVVMPTTSNLSDLTPLILTISDHATIDPPATTARDFSEFVIYEVTAQDNSTKTWTIKVILVDPDAEYHTYEAEHAEFTGKIDNQHANYTGSGFIDFLAGGDNFIIFTVCQMEAGEQTAKFRYSLAKDEERTGSLFVNDEFIRLIDFPRTETFADWREAITTVSLSAGVNRVKLTWESTDGPNLDKLTLSGEICESFSLNITATNNGKVILSPERHENTYFNGESVTLLAENKATLTFENWEGDLSGSTNPVQVVMDSDKNITAHFNVINVFSLSISINGIGAVDLDPLGGEYTEGTVVTLTAKPLLSSDFLGWNGDLSGENLIETITMNGDKNVTANFTSDFNIDFDKVVGFASTITTEFAEFNGPTTGGMNSQDTIWINGQADMDKLSILLYDRYRAYRNKTDYLSAKYAPLTIILKEGVYVGDGVNTSSFGNHMLTVQDQGDLTIMGEKNVVLNFGINIKRAWNILVRNITFQDYYDDGINIENPETHHIWIDHCTFGHPTTMPADRDHPDGGVDIKSGASYITVSWSFFRHSWKTGLVGHSDSNEAQDLGRLKVTYYGNYYYNTNSRNPRVRFGEVHFLNNMEEGIILYGIAASNKSQVFAENNYFLNTRWPMYADRALNDFREVYGINTDGVFTSKTGNIAATGLKATGNEYDDSGLPLITAQIKPEMLNPSGRSIKFDQLNPQNVFDPKTYYNYDALPASVVKTIVPMFAGADKLDFFAPSPDPVIMVSGTLSPFNQTIGSPSTIQTYKVSGTDLTEQIVITPPSNFEVSGDGNTWHNNESPLVLTPSEGLVEETTISVRLNSGSAGSHSGNIVHASSGVAQVLLEVNGTSVERPVIHTSGTLNDFSQTVGWISAVQIYEVSGTNLTANLIITPPVNYEVSADGGTTWFSNGAPLSLAPSEGEVAASISVRLNSSMEGTYNGNISHESADAVTVIVSVSGTTTDPISNIPKGKNKSFTIHNNPVYDILILIHPNLELNTIVMIYKVNGEKVGMYTAQAGTYSTEMNVSSLSKGTYILYYLNQKESGSIKFVKK